MKPVFVQLFAGAWTQRILVSVNIFSNAIIDSWDKREFKKRVREMSSQLFVTLHTLSTYLSAHKQLRRHLLNLFREFGVVYGEFGASTDWQMQKKFFFLHPTDIQFFRVKCLLDVEKNLFLHLSVCRSTKFPIYATPSSRKRFGRCRLSCLCAER